MAAVDGASGTKRRYRSLTLPALAALMLIVTAAVCLLIGQPPALQVSRLPDGSTLRLEAVTMGPQHRVVLGRYWQRLLAGPLSPALGAGWGPTTCAFGPSSPSTAVFWLTRKSNFPMNRCRAVAFDVSGDEVEVTTGPFRSSLASGEEIWAWTLPAFPRRGPWLGLRIYFNAWAQPVAQFRVRNPSPGPHPTWKAPVPPVTTTCGSLSFTLDRLDTGQVAPSSAPAPYRDRHWTHAAFRVRERGRPTDRWEPVDITLTDATGNRIVPWEANRQQEQNESHLRFRGNLPTHESAWKLRVEFALVRQLTSDEQWKVDGVSVPKRWGSSQLTVASRNRGLRLRVNVVRIPYPYGRGNSPVSLRVDAQAPALPSGVRLALVRAVDDRGRVSVIDPGRRLSFLSVAHEYESAGLRVTRPGGSSMYAPLLTPMGSYFVRTFADASTLDLTFAVVRSRFVEFLARPVERQTGPGA